MQEFLVVRHGQTDWNVENRWQGWLDPPLNETGRQQATQRSQHLDQEPRFNALVTSDLQRAAETARILGQHLGLQVTESAAFRERHGGLWEGHTAEEIELRWPTERAAWRERKIDSPPEGENDEVLWARVLQGIEELPEKRALVVTHGGLINLLKHRAGGELGRVPNLSGIWFRWDGRSLSGGSQLPDLGFDAQAGSQTTD